jgi:hypothetical protein
MPPVRQALADGTLPMSSFTEPLIVEVVQKDRCPFRVVRPFIYEVGHRGSGHLLIVPPGFETDFASVPFGFRWLVPVVGRHGKAAVLHDWLYETHIVSRRRADEIFFEAMGVLGVPAWRKWLAWAAVRLFGATAWRRAALLKTRCKE